MREDLSQYDRTPPHSIDAEMCMLASMMLDKRVIGEVMQLVDRNALYQADHQIIFDVLGKLYERNSAIDAVLVREELIKLHLLEEIGGTQYLARILEAVPSAVHGTHYASIVAKKFRLRTLQSLANDIKRQTEAPSDRDDPSQEILDHLAAEIVKLQRQGQSSTITTLGENIREFLFHRFDDGAERIFCGLSTLDDGFGGFAVGQYHLIAGRPGSGKSLVAKQIILNISRGVRVTLIGREPSDQPPFSVGIVSLEEGKRKMAVDMIANITEIENRKMTYKTATDEEWNVAESVLEKSDPLPFFTKCDVSTLPEVRNAITQLVLEHKCRVVVVDYLQLIDFEDSRMSETEKISKISKSLKHLGRQLDVALIICAQLNRGNETSMGKGKIRRPQITDVKQSGQIEQDADVVMLLHREDYYHRKDNSYRFTNKLEVDLAKVKEGPPGQANLQFIGRTQSVKDFPEEEERRLAAEKVKEEEEAAADAAAQEVPDFNLYGRG